MRYWQTVGKTLFEEREKVIVKPVLDRGLAPVADEHVIAVVGNRNQVIQA